MMFLEMARALQRLGREPAANEQLPIPADLRLLVTDRLRGLSPPTRRMLLITAALAQPTDLSVRAATDDPVKFRHALTEAIDAGILELEGRRLRFSHPLIGSIPLEDLTPEDRRALHRQLARTVADPEQHARHAALGAAATSEPVAAALDLAAAHARGRGSLTSAAELSELALTATPPTAQADLLRRTVTTAENLYLLGDPVGARTILTTRLHAAPPGPQRVPGLLLEATISSWEQGDASVASLCERALVEAGDDPLLQARCHATFSDTSPSNAQEDFVHAQRAVELLQAIDSAPADLLSNALTNLATHGCRLGRGLAVSALERAVELQSAATALSIGERPGMGLGMYLKVVDRFDDSRHWLHAMRTAAVEEGDNIALPMILGHLATLECWAGNYQLALQFAEQGRQQATRNGCSAPMPASAHVLVLAHLGRLTEARRLGERDLASDDALGFDSATALHHRSLGFTELFAGETAAAAAHFTRALSIARDMEIGEPAIMRLHPHAVAAFVHLGDLERARALTAELDASRERSNLPWAKAMAQRCHGLLEAASGNPSAAVDALERALAEHPRLAMPFEEACTRLLLGTVLRRIGRRADARQQLTTALTDFLRLDTPVHADRTRAELAGIGGRSGGADDLTATEHRVATLVGTGRTSREVAAALFLSVRTVDSHLGRVYRKLGLRSRTELAVWIADQPPAQTTT